MAWLMTLRDYYRSFRLSALLLALMAALCIRQCQRPVPEQSSPAILPVQLVAFTPAYPADGDTGTARGAVRPAGGLFHLERRSLPRSQWRGFRGPAYLEYPLPRRPKQAQLDEAARAHLHTI